MSKSETIKELHQITIKTLHRPDFSQNRQLSNKLSYFKIKDDVTVQAREIYIEEYDFTIDDEVVKFITYGDYESYTFLILRTEDNGYVENLLLSKQKDGSYSATILTYDLSEQEKEAVDNGQIIPDLSTKTTVMPLSRSLDHDSRYHWTGEGSIYWDEETGGCVRPVFDNLGTTVSFAMVPWGCPEGYNHGSLSEDDNGTGTGTATGDGTDNGNPDGTDPDGADPQDPIEDTNPFGGLTGGDGTSGDEGSTTGGSGDGDGINNEESENDGCLQEDANGNCIEGITVIVIDKDTPRRNNINDCLGEGTSGLVNNLSSETLTNVYDYLITQNNCSEEAQESMILAIESLSSYSENDFPGIDLAYDYEWWLDEGFVEENFNFDIDEGGFGDLTAQEKILVALYPLEALLIRANKEPTETETENIFGFNGLNDKSDAFRHAYFNAMNSNDAGDTVARLFSTAHESEVPVVLVLEKDMDLDNNNVGHNTGNEAGFFVSDQELSNTIYQILTNGGLVYLNPLDWIASPRYDANNNGLQDCNNCLNGIISTTTLIPTN